MTKDEKNKNKLKKMEEKYCPQEYFVFQRRKLKNPLNTSIYNTIKYINKNMPKYCTKDIYKTYGKIDFNSKQLFGISVSIITSMITSILINIFSELSLESTNIIKQGQDASSRFILGLISIFIMFLISILAVIGILVLFNSFKKQYYDEYSLFIAPYERQKAIEAIEKEVDNFNYRNIL